MISNMDKAIEFYQDKLGLELINRYGDYYAEIQAPDLLIGLHPTSEKIVQGNNLSIGFGVVEFDSTIKELESKGIEFRLEQNGWIRLVSICDFARRMLCYQRERILWNVFGLVYLMLFALVISSCNSESPLDPVPVGFGEERIFPTHREIDVGFASDDGTVLAGTLSLPLNSGPHPAILFHFGFGEWSRARYESSAIREWVNEGIAVLSYDKRGVGLSGGECCPWQEIGYFPLLAQDILSGIQLITTHQDIDASRVGVWGFSEGGWVVPITGASAPNQIAFVIIGSGPAVNHREELLYSFLTGDDQQCQPTGLSDEEIWEIIDSGGPNPDPVPFIQGTGFDPLPFIENMTQPSLWVYGDLDTSVPVARSIENLEQVRKERSLDLSVVVLENANHSWVEGGAMCQETGQFVDALTPIFAWLLPRLFF